MTDDPDNPQQPANPKHRAVRSFVLRGGRLTSGQKRALKELWPQHGINLPPGLINLPLEFKNTAPVTLEIGFGNGENIISMAKNDRQGNYLGIEVHEPGVGHCLLGIEEHDLSNVRVMRDDAVAVLRQHIEDAALSRINLFFPDPWHKKRHHKRRIVQPDFIRLLARKLRPGGTFHVATDWPNYAEHIELIMNDIDLFESAHNVPGDRIETRFDLRGQRIGHDNWEHAWCTRSI